MGCIAGKTGHTDHSETESTISTVSFRRRSFPYDDNCSDLEIEEEKEIQAEEKEIEAELEGKKTRGKKTKSVSNKKDTNRNTKTVTVEKKKETGKAVDKENPEGEEDTTNKNNQDKEKQQADSRKADAAKKDEIKEEAKDAEIDKSEDKRTDKDNVDGKANVDKIVKNDSNIGHTNANSGEKENMGNTGSKIEQENKETMGKDNDNIDKNNDNDKEIETDELQDDHHVHWQDENKNKINGVKITPKDPGVKLMRTPSARVMSAHVRRGSLKHSAGKERRLSLRMSAGNERRSSLKHSASKESRASGVSEGKDETDIDNEEHKMEDEKKETAEGEEENADNYADVEEMIQDEMEKDDEEDDIDSFNDDDLSSAQMTDRAPSLSMWYDDNVPGDILTTQIYVPSFGLTRYTYYCCLQWNSGKDGGGYCGLQDHEHGRNYIFSIWDPVDSEGSIKPVYIGPGTTCEPFGGEGTGLKSWNFDLGWEPDCWYTLVTRRWDHEGHTRYGLWVKHHLECFWTHIVTVDFPMPGIYYDTWTCSFIEDWEGSGHRVRRAHLRNGFKRKHTGQWIPFDKAVLGMVKETGSRRYRGSFDAGNFDEMFFLQSGGESIPTEGISEGSCFYSVSDDKPTEVPISCVLTTVTATEMVWEVSEGSVPQFQYAIKIDGELYKQEVNSEMRVCKFESPPQKLVEIFVEDILGRHANAKYVVREKLKSKSSSANSKR